MKITQESSKSGDWRLLAVRKYKTSERALRELRKALDKVRLSDCCFTRFAVYNSRGDKVLTVTWDEFAGWQDRGAWA